MEDCKMTYERAEIEIIEFENEDIVTMSIIDSSEGGNIDFSELQ